MLREYEIPSYLVVDIWSEWSEQSLKKAIEEVNKRNLLIAIIQHNMEGEAIPQQFAINYVFNQLGLSVDSIINTIGKIYEKNKNH